MTIQKIFLKILFYLFAHLIILTGLVDATNDDWGVIAVVFLGMIFTGLSVLIYAIYLLHKRLPKRKTGTETDSISVATTNSLPPLSTGVYVAYIFVVIVGLAIVGYLYMYFLEFGADLI